MNAPRNDDNFLMPDKKSAKNIIKKQHSDNLFLGHFKQNIWYKTDNVCRQAKNNHVYIVLLHCAKPRPASKNYSLQVAKLAGIPQPTIEQLR